MWKFSLNHSCVIAKYLVTCVLVYIIINVMQFLSNNFKILKVNGLTLIIEEMWQK
jgi:hypothetical protein